MGKTKTAFISDLSGGEKSGKEAYEEKMKKKAIRDAAANISKEKAQVHGVGLKGGERIKVIGGSDLPSVEPVTAEEPQGEEVKVSTRQKKIRVRGKKYKETLVKYDKTKHFGVSEAVKLVKETSYSKFDGTVELHVVTKTEINKQVELPFFAGKTKKVEIASESTIEKLKNGKIDFDVLLATVDMMPKLVPFAKTLGPRGMMPNPKNGTLIKSPKDADKFSGAAINTKTQKDQNVIHLGIGKVSQKEAELVKNLTVVFDTIDRKKIEKAYLSPTMGPSVKVQF